jgi:hypothetical protein
VSFTIDELLELLKEREDTDDILELLSPTPEELVEALSYMVEDSPSIMYSLQQRYEVDREDN